MSSGADPADQSTAGDSTDWELGWVWAFIDRPAAGFEVAADFWCAVTGTTLSPRRGEVDEFATFLPLIGDAHLKLQAIAGQCPGGHLDFEVTDVPAALAHAVDHGATRVADLGTLQVLHSPAGLPFCLVPAGGSRVLAPVAETEGGLIRADQVAIDVGPSHARQELIFWEALTRWIRLTSIRDQFTVLHSPEEMPVRLLIQRLETEQPPRVHLDLACSDVAAATAYHQALGATVVSRHLFWTTMSDPAGGLYCITARDPHTGRLT